MFALGDHLTSLQGEALPACLRTDIPRVYTGHPLYMRSIIHNFSLYKRECIIHENIYLIGHVATSILMHPVSSADTNVKIRESESSGCRFNDRCQLSNAESEHFINFSKRLPRMPESARDDSIVYFAILA
jgi:hypothetical protein